MPQSLARLIAHLVFSTKNRRPFIDDAVRSGLHRYLGGALKNLECYPIEIGGTKDHVHVLVILSKNHAPIKIVEEVKRTSSKWMKTQHETYGDFYWQGGYGLFSVSESNLDGVREYIRRQDEHHKKMTFQDEFRELLRRHNIEFDERYVWD